MRVSANVGLAHLAAQGIQVGETDNVRGVAELHALRPIELLRIILQF